MTTDWHRCWVPGCGAEVYYRLYAEGYHGMIVGFCAKHEPWFEWRTPSGSKQRVIEESPESSHERIRREERRRV